MEWTIPGTVLVVPKEEGNWFQRTWNAVVDFLT